MTSYPPPVTSPAWSARTKRTVLLICLLLVGLTVWRVNDTLPVIIIAFILSYLLYPLATWFDRRVLRDEGRIGDSRGTMAILLTFAVVFAFLALVVLVIVPTLVEQLRMFGEQLPQLVQTVQGELERILSQPIVIGDQRFVPLESLETVLGAPPDGDFAPFQNINLPETVSSFARSLTGPAFGFVGGAFSALINVVFLLTLMFYLLKDGARFIEKTVEVTPEPYRSDVRRLFYELGKVWSAYLSGQLALCLIMGVVVFVAATVLGLPNAIILGLLAGLLEFIPNIGPAIALIPAGLLALGTHSSTLPFLEGVPFAIVVIVVWTLLQNIESVVIVPRVMGGSLNLHAFVIIVGVLAGASLAGALGVILAAPTIASIRVLGQYIYGKLTDRDPFPPPDASELRREQRSRLGHRLSLAARYLRVWLSQLGARLQGRRGGKSAVE